MGDEFRRFWLHDELHGARYVPVIASNGQEAQQLVLLTALMPPHAAEPFGHSRQTPGMRHRQMASPLGHTIPPPLELSGDGEVAQSARAAGDSARATRRLQ